MTLQDIIAKLDLRVLTAPKDFAGVTPLSGYTSDLLSCVMTGAKRGDLWVTLQAHGNIVAVAALVELAAVIITENAQPDPATMAKANEQGVTLLSARQPSFAVVGQLWEMGLREG
jgi:hypothetical protein